MTKTNWEETIAHQDTISFGAAFKAGIVIVIVSALALASGAWLSWQRQNRVIHTYNLETERYLQNNQEAVKSLFTTVFDDCYAEYIATQSGKNNYYPDISCSAAKTHFSVLQLDQLKDPSAIAFMKGDVNNQYALIEASGNYRHYQNLENAYFINWNTRDDLRDYLELKQEITMWQDFLNYITGKEVLIPVEYDGQLYGYIFRGVIERQ